MSDPVTSAKSFLRYDPSDIADIERRLDEVHAVYFGLAEYIARTGKSAGDLELEIDARRADLYVQYRDMKQEAKLTEPAIDAMIRVDPQLKSMKQRLSDLSVSTQLLQTLLKRLAAVEHRMEFIVSSRQKSAV